MTRAEKNADTRARERLHALNMAIKFAADRRRICEESAAQYRAKTPPDLQSAPTETCAWHEARYIHDELVRLKKEADIQCRRAASMETDP